MATPEDTLIQYLKGIGPKRAKLFGAMGIYTIDDLFYYFPRRYEDRTNVSKISELKEGQFAVIKAEVLSKKKRTSFARRSLSIIEAVLSDPTGRLTIVWFNQPYIEDYFQAQDTLVVYGKVERYGNRLQMTNPEFEPLDKEDESLNIGRIVPVYPQRENLSQRNLRKLLRLALDQYLPRLNDFLPYDMRLRNKLVNLAQALNQIHFPDSLELQKEAYRRLAFEEFLLFQVPLALRKLKKSEKKGIAHKGQGDLLDSFLSGLTFKLTNSQSRVLDEIRQDMQKLAPMQRLLQGDVGCGKTVIATCACLIAAQGGYQSVFMVPTEILAKQHFEKISQQLGSLLPQHKIRIGLLTGSISRKEKEAIERKIRLGELELVIGTHALIEERVQFRSLGLVVIDEQHKFGVAQRALLPEKGANPDLLIMTATPIPRTLAITLYGDLDISVITELPPGRIAVKTMHLAEDKRQQAYRIVKNELAYGRQAFIIYPVIEDSYAMDIAGAEKMFAKLKAGVFRQFKVGIVHGRLKQAEQDEVMLKFKNKEMDILVATTVLEVGLDIPNASCMVIERAERFGLAQLHQLRGRIGRGQWESVCMLISDAQTPEAASRIKAMVEYSDGFRIAEEDLKIRGPGEFFGRRQHGLSELKVANPLMQMQLLKKARDEAGKIIKSDPRLKLRQNMALKQRLLYKFPGHEKLMLAG